MARLPTRADLSLFTQETPNEMMRRASQIEATVPCNDETITGNADGTWTILRRFGAGSSIEYRVRQGGDPHSWDDRFVSAINLTHAMAQSSPQSGYIADTPDSTMGILAGIADITNRQAASSIADAISGMLMTPLDRRMDRPGFGSALPDLLRTEHMSSNTAAMLAAANPFPTPQELVAFQVAMFTCMTRDIVDLIERHEAPAWFTAVDAVKNGRLPLRAGAQAYRMLTVLHGAMVDAYEWEQREEAARASRTFKRPGRRMVMPDE